MIPLDFHFERSHLGILLFFVALFIVLYLLFFLYQHTALKKFCDTVLLKLLMPLHALTNRKVQAAALIFTWLFATLAIMDPVGNGKYPEEKNSGTFNVSKIDQEVTFIVDTSASMSVADGLAGQTRLNKSKEVMDTLLNMLKGETISLIPFTSQAVLAVPPTNDYVFTRLILNNTSINATDIPGTDLLQAMNFVSSRLKQEPLNRIKTLILFSDGGDTTWESDSGPTKSEREKTIEQSLKDLPDDNINLIVVGVGSTKESPIPNVTYKGESVNSVLQVQLLKNIANSSNGVYLQASDFSSLDLAKKISGLIEEYGSPQGIMNKQLAKTSISSTHLIYELFFQIPLAIALTTLAIVVYRFRNVGEPLI
jgi:Ca-activated chloride channel family protein